MVSHQTRTVLLAAVCAAIGIGFGVIIGYFSNNNGSSSPSEPEKPQENQDAAQMIMDEIKTAKLEEYLRYKRMFVNTDNSRQDI